MKKFISMILAVFLAITQCSFALADTVSTETPIPISSYADLKQIERNPSGSYYLTQDIELPERARITVSFSGTFDGNGHALKNLTVTGTDSYFGLFGEIYGDAVIKNLKIEDVNIDIKNDKKETLRVKILSHILTSGKIENIELSGNIKIEKTNGGLSCATIAEANGEQIIEGIKSDLDFEIEGDPTGADFDITMCFGDNVTYKNCSNTGDFRVSLHAGNKKNAWLNAAGITTITYGQLLNCQNSGNFYLTTENPNVWLNAGGVVGAGKDVSLCKNEGKIQANGFTKANRIGGVAAYIYNSISESFNTGAISSRSTGGTIGGLAGIVEGKTKDCYNTGKVIVSGKLKKQANYVGGLVGFQATTIDDKLSLTSCYQTGSVKAPSKALTGAICGNLDNYLKKSVVKNIYYTKNMKPFGTTARKATAYKVSDINKKKCKGFSTKIWKYSSSKKRMILKNNPE